MPVPYTEEIKGLIETLNQGEECHPLADTYAIIHTGFLLAMESCIFYFTDIP